MSTFARPVSEGFPRESDEAARLTHNREAMAQAEARRKREAEIRKEQQAAEREKG